MRFMEKIKKIIIMNKYMILIIIGLFLCFVGGSYAYFSSNAINNDAITGNASIMDLELTVTRVLPENENVNSMLIFQFDELARNLNAGCVDQDGQYSLCQLYKVNLKNKINSTNVKIKGSLSFSNADMPNLSWVLLGNTYDSSDNYTSDIFGDTFNTASSEYTSFVDDYLLKRGKEIDFYILVWINETDRVQYDRGSYTGIVRFEDGHKNGITAEFGNTGSDNNRYNSFVNTVMRPEAISDEELDFSLTSSENNTNGIYLKSDTQNELHPIYYYRGDVDNNLIFAGFCWKVVRTTETGGLKLLYNGVANNNQCNNSSNSTSISTMVFNAKWNLLSYVGYMYSDPYTYSNKNIKNITDEYYYANDVKYENGMYILDESKKIVHSSSWASIYNSGLNNTHYTCFSTGTTCSEVHYIYYTSASSAYYITLSGGEKIEDALKIMLGADGANKVNYNKVSSTIKGNNTTEGTLDYWYYTNIEQKGYNSYIEDTVWCNDRAIDSYGGWNPNGGSNRSLMFFSANNRVSNTYDPSLTCSRNIDSFTKDVKNGNGNLDYSVGLLTTDEVMLAGGVYGKNNSDYYLYTGYDFWLGTPIGFGMDVAVLYYVSSTGSMADNFVNVTYGVRPAISLKLGFNLTGNGDGTETNPYIIE